MPPFAGAIDCDVHLPVPRTVDLMPYLDAHWREEVVTRGIDGFELSAYPPLIPANCREDWRSGHGAENREGSKAALDALRHNLLDPFGTDIAICNCLHGGMAAFSEDLSLALLRAVNDWTVAEWLDQEPRLRGSILVPPRNPDMAAAEIERLAADHRFVQVILPVSGPMPLGRRQYWPLYEAAQRHRLTIGIHAGGLGYHPSSPSGWNQLYLQDYVSQSGAFQNQLASLVGEGTLGQFPDLNFVMIESGVTWLPNFLWRADKTWMGLRNEIPWVARPPSEYIHDQVYLTTQPFDAPGSVEQMQAFLGQAEFDRLLLFSTDYPHRHFDGTDAMPAGLSNTLMDWMTGEGPRRAYPRLRP